MYKMSLYCQFLVCYSVPKAYPVLSVITSTVHTLFPSMSWTISCMFFVVLAQAMYRDSDNSVDIVFWFISSDLKMFFHTCRQPVIISGEIWRVWRMCQHLPAPLMHQILHITMVLSCSIILEQNDTILKQFWLFVVNSWPHFMLQDCAVILAIDCSTNWLYIDYQLDAPIIIYS